MELLFGRRTHATMHGRTDRRGSRNSYLDSTHKIGILTKFHNDRAEIVDFLFKAYFWDWVKIFLTVSILEDNK